MQILMKKKKHQEVHKGIVILLVQEQELSKHLHVVKADKILNALMVMF